MVRPIVLQGAKRGRGNPNWGNFVRPLPVVLTEFEVQVKRLGLSREQYVASATLKSWCERNHNRCYVPEWLLDEWEIIVESIFSGLA